ncbi:MAG: hypothetical protein ACJA2D_001815 [Pseudohongiellaceae bacterium]|jgi:hypothetical protein
MYTFTLLGIVTGMAAIVLLVKPKVGFDFGHKYFLTSAFQYGAVVLSLLLAVALYYSSSTSKFPAFFEIFSLFVLSGGVICLLLPPSYFKEIVSWELKTFSPYGRILGLFYGIIGGFFIYAAN